MYCVLYYSPLLLDESGKYIKICEETIISTCMKLKKYENLLIQKKSSISVIAVIIMMDHI